MNNLPTTVIVILTTALVLFFIKTIHFLIATHHKKLLNWFYFNKYSINTSHNFQSATAKKTQNILTLILAFVLVSALVMEFLTR
jgi:hypothetical protein